MSLLVDEVAMYFVSAIFISVNGCALVQFVAHDDWLEFEFLLDWKFIFAELIVFSSERAFWVFFQTTTKGKKHKQSQDPETLGKVHFKTRNDKTTKETIYSRNICELKENPRRFVYTQKNDSTLTYAGRVELWKSVK